MKIVVGLGNPGRQYEATRHNVGFDTLRLLAEQHGAEPPKAKFESYVAEATIAGQRALLVWPQTYMNRSGRAVRAATTFYKTALEDLLIICDDLALDVGRLRMRAKGSSGGQNGLKDVAQQLGDEAYHRLRIGVGPLPDGRDAADFVLGRFAPKERELVDVAIADAAAAAACWASEGVTAAMNKFNQLGA
ncbi:aminoacyl-tRNA hydrolase [Botrimarina sp.]|uniref:aminoacyl-tRNA hydrolase n=1 Tax=Botrimarina sp. TaxID=2795802 RepID=UPI0032EF4B1C